MGEIFWILYRYLSTNSQVKLSKTEGVEFKGIEGIKAKNFSFFYFDISYSYLLSFQNRVKLYSTNVTFDLLTIYEIWFFCVSYFVLIFNIKEYQFWWTQCLISMNTMPHQGTFDFSYPIWTRVYLLPIWTRGCKIALHSKTLENAYSPMRLTQNESINIKFWN